MTNAGSHDAALRELASLQLTCSRAAARLQATDATATGPCVRGCACSLRCGNALCQITAIASSTSANPNATIADSGRMLCRTRPVQHKRKYSSACIPLNAQLKTNMRHQRQICAGGNTNTRCCEERHSESAQLGASGNRALGPWPWHKDWAGSQSAPSCSGPPAASSTRASAPPSRHAARAA